MTARPLRFLILSDGRPGHFHLSEGVVAAAERLRPVERITYRLHRRKIAFGRLLRWLLFHGEMGARLVLRLGYGLSPEDFPQADVIVSTGGNTLPANVALARLRNIPNILCSTPRNLPPEDFSLIITSYARHAHKPRHAVTLKPNLMDPDALGRPQVIPRFGADHPPRLAGLLLGGNSGYFRYEKDEWEALAQFLRQVSEAWGTRWLVSTSRRTGDLATNLFSALAEEPHVVAEFIDYRKAGPGSLRGLFQKADVILATADSSTMITEAVAARFPIVAVSPRHFGYKAEEAEYREYLASQGWYASLPLAELTLANFSQALEALTPMTENHLDHLAGILSTHLPCLTEQLTPSPDRKSDD